MFFRHYRGLSLERNHKLRNDTFCYIQHEGPPNLHGSVLIQRPVKEAYALYTFCTRERFRSRKVYLRAVDVKPTRHTQRTVCKRSWL